MILIVVVLRLLNSPQSLSLFQKTGNGERENKNDGPFLSYFELAVLYGKLVAKQSTPGDSGNTGESSNWGRIHRKTIFSGITVRKPHWN